MNTALAFSGGKDSWACLWLNKGRLDDIYVIWVNTGKNYPELLETIAYAKSLCKNFIELNVDRGAQNEREGLPVDVIPVAFSKIGQLVTGATGTLVQPYLQCCIENIANPLNSYCRDNGITTVIKGQRIDEHHKTPSINGSVINGITYEQPIEQWTAEEVLAFNALYMDIPEHFKFKHSSMDCYDCTAFTAVTRDLKQHCKDTYPGLHEEYSDRKQAVDMVMIQAFKEYFNG